MSNKVVSKRGISEKDLVTSRQSINGSKNNKDNTAAERVTALSSLPDLGAPIPNFDRWKVPNILLVDSDITSVQHLQSIAHQVNCDTSFALDASAAIEICEHDDKKDRLALDKIDLLIIELALPDMSGIKLAGMLRRPFILILDGDTIDSMDAVLSVCRSIDNVTLLNALTRPLQEDSVELALLSGISFIEEYLKQEIRFRTRIDTCLKIEKAKGILQERYRISSRQAESVLREASMAERKRLYRIAELICQRAEEAYKDTDVLTGTLRDWFEKPLESKLKD